MRLAACFRSVFGIALLLHVPYASAGPAEACKVVYRKTAEVLGAIGRGTLKLAVPSYRDRTLARAYIEGRMFLGTGSMWDVQQTLAVALGKKELTENHPSLSWEIEAVQRTLSRGTDRNDLWENFASASEAADLILKGMTLDYDGKPNAAFAEYLKKRVADQVRAEFRIDRAEALLGRKLSHDEQVGIFNAGQMSSPDEQKKILKQVFRTPGDDLNYFSGRRNSVANETAVDRLLHGGIFDPVNMPDDPELYLKARKNQRDAEQAAQWAREDAARKAKSEAAERAAAAKKAEEARRAEEQARARKAREQQTSEQQARDQQARDQRDRQARANTRRDPPPKPAKYDLPGIPAGWVPGQSLRVSQSYAVLGLKQGDSYDAVKSSVRKLSRKYHPDVVGSNKFEAEFKAVSTAYEVLDKLLNP